MITRIKDKGVIAKTTVALIVTASLTLLLFSFVSMRGLRAQYSQCNLMETKVLETRKMIGSVGQVQAKRTLPAEKKIAPIINALKKHGEAQGIEFISLTPQTLQEDHATGYKILPVEMKIASPYEQLAVFLGSLDNPEEGLIKVVSFAIVPDAAAPTQCTAGLIVHIYLSGGQNAE